MLNIHKIRLFSAIAYFYDCYPNNVYLGDTDETFTHALQRLLQVSYVNTHEMTLQHRSLVPSTDNTTYHKRNVYFKWAHKQGEIHELRLTWRLHSSVGTDCGLTCSNTVISVDGYPDDGDYIFFPDWGLQPQKLFKIPCCHNPKQHHLQTNYS